MKFSCPECGQRIEVKETWIGRTIDCPNSSCGHRFTIRVPLPKAAPFVEASKSTPPPADQPAKVLPAVPLPTPPGSRESAADRPQPPTPPVPSKTRTRFPIGTTVQAALIFALGGCLLALTWFDESPQQFWRRLTGAPVALAVPAPAKPPAPVPAATPVPTPEAVMAVPATPLPSVAPPVGPDAVAWLREHTGSWPKNLTLLKAADFQVISGERIAGSSRMPADTAVALVGFRENGVVEVSSLGSTARVPIGDFDLRERARKAMAEAAVLEEGQTAARTTVPPPAAATPAPDVALAPGALPELPGLPMETESRQQEVTSRGSAVVPDVAQEPSPAPSRAASYFGTAAGGGAGQTPSREFPTNGLLKTIDRESEKTDTVSGRRILLKGTAALRLTGAADPLPGSAVNFTSPDAWLFLENVRPSVVASTLLDRMWVSGVPAQMDANVRVVPYGSGTVVIPQGPDFEAMQVFKGADLTGTPMPLRPGVKYDDASLGTMKMSIGSFRLKRGYTATIAQEENGTGISKNYVAQDRDLEVKSLPAEFDKKIRFVRIFPWRWTSKKGVAGGIWQNLNVGWFYNWNISENARPDLEYVPIKQNRYWPGLKQDWIARGATTLLGYNEPDHKDQSNLTVDEAIAGWPDLLSTGLRLGSPAVSDGGLGWLFEFMQKADAANLRVDFVAVHYYRAVANPSDAKGAATQFYNYLRGIHERTHRPIWVTEWNNGANWTKHKPDYEQERAAIAEMVRMLEETPFVERYAIYNWVEDTRNVQRKDGSLTAAGEVYRDKVSVVGYTQARP